MLVVRGDDAVAGRPGQRCQDEVDPVGRGVGQRDVVRVRDEERGDRGARLRHPVQEGDELVDLRAAHGELAGGLLVHRPHGLGGQGDRTCPRSGRCRQPVAGSICRIAAIFSESGMKGDTTPVSYRRTCSIPPPRRPRGRLRPSRADRDTRLAGRQPRPAGCPGGGRALASGRHRRSAPRRGSRARGRPHRLAGRSVVEPTEDADMLLLASPERMASAMAAAGVADGTTVVLYDDTLSYHAARAWWSLRAYGFDTARVLDGGYPAWIEGAHADRGWRRGGRAVAVHAPAPGAPPRDHGGCARPPRGPRRPAGGRSRTGRVPRLRGQRPTPGPHPGRREPPGRRDAPARLAAAPGPGRAPRPAAQGQRHPRPPPGLLRPVRRGGSQARLGPARSSATRTSPSTTVVGRTGAPGWTCRSTSNAVGRRAGGAVR